MSRKHRNKCEAFNAVSRSYGQFNDFSFPDLENILAPRNESPVIPHWLPGSFRARNSIRKVHEKTRGPVPARRPFQRDPSLVPWTLSWHFFPHDTLGVGTLPLRAACLRTGQRPTTWLSSRSANQSLTLRNLKWELRKESGVSQQKRSSERCRVKAQMGHEGHFKLER